MAERQTISVFVVCFNEERNIRRCLESIKWCDEIVIVDSGSTDRTLAICGEYTPKIFVNSWPGYVKQKKFGLERCQGDWILNLDADEEVSPELKEELLSIATNPEPEVNGYFILRTVNFLGKWWRKGGWYPEYKLRFCKRKYASWGGRDPHEKALVEGKTRRLETEIYHYTYSSLEDQMSRMNRYSSAAAESMALEGVKFRFINLLVNPLARFLKFYFLKKGYREGMGGVIVGLIDAMYVYLKYAKLWEIEKRGK